jgi:hypothetical protein
MLVNEFGAYIPYNSKAVDLMPKLVAIVGNTDIANIPSFIGVICFSVLRSYAYRLGVERDWFEEDENFAGLFVKVLPEKMTTLTLKNSLDSLAPRFVLQSTTAEPSPTAASYSLRELVSLFLLPETDEHKLILRKFDKTLDIMKKMKTAGNVKGWFGSIQLQCGAIQYTSTAVKTKTETLDFIQKKKEPHGNLSDKRKKDFAELFTRIKKRAHELAGFFAIPTTQVFKDLMVKDPPEIPDDKKRKADKRKADELLESKRKADELLESKRKADELLESKEDDEVNEDSKEETNKDTDENSESSVATSEEKASSGQSKRSSSNADTRTGRVGSRNRNESKVDHIYEEEFQTIFPDIDMSPLDFPRPHPRGGAHKTIPTTKVAVMVSSAANDFFEAYLQIRFFETANYYINRRAKKEGKEAVTENLTTADAATKIKEALARSPAQWKHIEGFEASYGRIMQPYRNGLNFQFDEFNKSIVAYLKTVPSEQLFEISNIFDGNATVPSIDFRSHFGEHQEEEESDFEQPPVLDTPEGKAKMPAVRERSPRIADALAKKLALQDGTQSNATGGRRTGDQAPMRLSNFLAESTIPRYKDSPPKAKRANKRRLVDTKPAAKKKIPRLPKPPHNK